MFRVIYSSGSLCHQSTDFAIDGLVRCEFGRVYRSIPAVKGPLGFGWHWPWDVSVALEKDEFVYRALSGLVEERFRIDEAVNGSIRSKAGTVLHLGQNRILLSPANGWIYQFALPHPAHPLETLEVVRDLRGNACRCVNWNERLQEMTDANERRYRIIWDMDGRIEAIDLDGGVPNFPRRLVSYEYDWHGDLVRVIDRCGAESEYRYDDHLMVAYRNRIGGWYYADYDSSRRCIRTWRSDGRLTKSYRYDPVRRQLLVHDAAGYATLIRLDEESRLVEQIDPAGLKTTMVYDMQGGLVGTTTDVGISSTVSVMRDSRTSETRMCGADGCEYTVATDVATRQEVTTNCTGAKWTHTYDETGKLVEIVTPLGGTYRYEYDSRGQASGVTLPGGNTVRYIFSPDYRRLEVVDALGLVGSLAWDEEGRVIRRQMPECNTEQYRYDALGRVIEIVRPNGAGLQLGLDAEGNCVSVITETGDTRDAEWSPFGDLISGLDPLGSRFSNGYDEQARLVAVTNAAHETMRREYDPAGRVVAQEFFDGSTERYSYDRRGFLDSIWYADGTANKFVFDAAGRVVQSSDGQHSLRLDYDSRGYVVTAIRDGVAVQYEYDPEGHPIIEVQDGIVIAREYDVSGDCVSLSVQGLGVRRFKYDLRQRLVDVTDFSGEQIRIAYDLRDRFRTVSLGPDLGLEYQYLPENRIARIRLWNSIGTSEVSYSYDHAGRIAGRQGPGPQAVAFEYRPDGHLGRVLTNGNVQDYWYTETGDLTHDAAGQPIVFLQGGRIRAGSDRAYTFDERGRVIEIDQHDRRLRLTYDHLNSLVRVDDATNRTAEYRYDALGRRTRKITSSVETRFLWDGDWLMAESAASQNRTYLGSAWRVFCLSAMGRQGQAELLLSDLNGLPLVAASSSGLANLPSDIWGYSPEPPPRIPMRLAGQYEDSETGLYYNRYRYYDPQIRRYLTPDPLRLEGATNWYAYQTDPVNNIDPYGLATVTAHNCPPGTPSPKPTPPPTIASDPGCSRGSSVHNDCITKTRARARAAGYTTRADQSMTSGTGSNRPDLGMTMPGQQNVHVEWDNPPASRAAGHLADICAGDPGAVVFLVKLNARYGSGAAPGATSPGPRTPSSKMGKGSGLSDNDCGIDDINSGLTSRGMANI